MGLLDALLTSQHSYTLPEWHQPTIWLVGVASDLHPDVLTTNVKNVSEGSFISVVAERP